MTPDLFDGDGGQELAAERAAIMEHDGGLPRAEAERRAEQFRHQCEVRYCLKRAANLGMGWVDEYLGQVQRLRGEQAAKRLRLDCRLQWLAGNRGQEGDWR